MPALVRNYDPRTQGEVVLFSMDFSLNLQQGETLASSSWTCALSQGSDANPAGRVSGSAQISGNVTAQVITFATGTQPNNIYLLVGTVVTSLGQTLIGYATVSVVAPGST